MSKTKRTHSPDNRKGRQARKLCAARRLETVENL